MNSKLTCLFMNETWLSANGLDISDQLMVKIGFWIVETTFNPKALIAKPSEKVTKTLGKLKQAGMNEHYGIIIVDQDHSALFRENTGSEYVLESLKGTFDEPGTYYPNILVLGQQTGKKSLGQNRALPVLRPAAVYLVKREKPENLERIPVGVPGLAELLFPNEEPRRRGFKNPRSGRVVPRITVVKGAVGTGKTTLATQMMVKMAQEGFYCDYWCSNDLPQAIRDIAISFGFCDGTEFDMLSGIDPKISVVNIGHKYLEYLELGSLSEIALHETHSEPEKKVCKLTESTDVLFLDSLNASQLVKTQDRQTLWALFEKYRKLPLLSIFLLEDYGSDGTEEVRQLISDCEFLADVDIELAQGMREGYDVKAITVKKKHYGTQVYGSHCYKICPKVNSLPNLSDGAEYSNQGIVVFRSIHRYLSRARETKHKKDNQGKPKLVHTGITHVDAMLMGGSHEINAGNNGRDIDQGCIEENSCIVISGERGGHKLPLGLNMLMGGMWKVVSDKSRKNIAADSDVLLILLDEEADIHIRESAMARNTHLFTDAELGLGSLDNGAWLKWKPKGHKKHNRDLKCDWPQLFEEEKNIGKKVVFKRWCASILDKDAQIIDCRKLVVAGFRPGCITPEEFIYIVSTLLKSSIEKKSPFSRVLFVSTAHLQSRFPLLGHSDLFIPAVVDLFKSQNLISIFIDIKGEGSNEKLSYGLVALADYLICVNEFSRGMKQPKLIYPNRFKKESYEKIKNILTDNIQRYVCSKVHIESVRGKEYSRPCHAVTVRPNSKNEEENDLYVINAHDPETIQFEFTESQD